MTDIQTAHRGPSAPLPEPIDHVVNAARDKKAANLLVLDLRPANGFTDYFVICSGRSNRQVRAIAESLEARLKAIGRRPAHIEGTGTDWVLIDCFDFIIHVFTPESRDFYSLERLWGSAERVEV